MYPVADKIPEVNYPLVWFSIESFSFILITIILGYRLKSNNYDYYYILKSSNYRTFIIETENNLSLYRKVSFCATEDSSPWTFLCKSLDHAGRQYK